LPGAFHKAAAEDILPGGLEHLFHFRIVAKALQFFSGHPTKVRPCFFYFPLMAKRVLYGVLNWGLGHATRSKVLIDNLLHAGHDVVLASDGLSAQWLQRTFPALELRSLPAYRIAYSNTGLGFLPKMLAQLPRLAACLREETRLLSRWQARDGFDALISDHRLGLHHPDLPTALLAHQWHLPVPFSALASWAQDRYLRRFDHHWFPDYPDRPFSGRLSRSTHPKLASSLRAIGPLSRFEGEKPGQGRHLLAILSGPEPQRSLLEAKIIAQAAELDEPLHLVSGRPGPPPKGLPPSVQWYGILEGMELSALLLGARLVIGRSGYSSIMDYAALGKRALLIDTPGQGEQAYLARFHAERGHFQWCKQAELDLPRLLSAGEGQAVALPFRPERNRALRGEALAALFQGKIEG